MTEELREQIRDTINRERENIVSFLGKIVGQNSFTENLEGINRVAEIIAREMPGSFEHEIIENDGPYAPHHLFKKKGEAKKSLHMAGHMDTLWEERSDFKELSVNSDKLTGPAVFDMKGGIAVIVWALKTLDRCGMLDSLPLTVLFNSDEEVGSATSQDIYPSLKDKVSAALVYEGSEEGGTIVIKRIGIARFKMEFKGISAHSGLFSGKKSSAILELAHIIPWLESFNVDRNKLTLNVGKISGGIATNVIPDSAECSFEIRFWKEQYLKEALEEIKKRTLEPVLPGCRIKFYNTARTMPPLDSKATEKLFEIVSATAGTLGQKVIPQGRNGGSDASWLTSAGIPSIDGLGPIGGLGRTTEEYIYADSLFDRIELTANLLLLPELYNFKSTGQ